MMLPIKNVFPVKTSFPHHLARQPHTLRGLGDAVALVAEPIKHGLQAILPKRLSDKLNDCGCDKRRTALNNAFPFTKP